MYETLDCPGIHLCQPFLLQWQCGSQKLMPTHPSHTNTQKCLPYASPTVSDISLKTQYLIVTFLTSYVSQAHCQELHGAYHFWIDEYYCHSALSQSRATLRNTIMRATRITSAEINNKNSQIKYNQSCYSNLYRRM